MINEWILKKTVTDIIHELGIPANLKGHEYLRKAIMMSVKDAAAVNHITIAVYPVIAAQSGTTKIAVERAMRHAIGVGWERGNKETIDELFGYTVDSGKGKPKNSEFIAIIADYIRLQEEAE